MTKTENRAAAKAFHEDRERKRSEEWRAQAVAADLEQLDKLRHYLIFQTKARVPARELLDAIDDDCSRRSKAASVGGLFHANSSAPAALPLSSVSCREYFRQPVTR
jgi:hypothetical protein